VPGWRFAWLDFCKARLGLDAALRRHAPQEEITKPAEGRIEKVRKAT